MIIINTENKIKPLPLGRGRLLCNRLLFPRKSLRLGFSGPQNSTLQNFVGSVTQLQESLILEASEILRFLTTPNKPCNLMHGKKQGVCDIR